MLWDKVNNSVKVFSNSQFNAAPLTPAPLLCYTPSHNPFGEGGAHGHKHHKTYTAA
jgi:hypothetical protein